MIYSLGPIDARSFYGLILWSDRHPSFFLAQEIPRELGSHEDDSAGHPQKKLGPRVKPFAA